MIGSISFYRIGVACPRRLFDSLRDALQKREVESLLLTNLKFKFIFVSMSANYFDRAISDILKRQAANAKCLLVTGPRQVGKSTLLKKTYPNVRYITFDDLIAKNQAATEPGLFFLNNPPPVIIDEVQTVPEIFPYIKMRCDNSEMNGNFYLTGSQSMQLMKNVSESLAGRISILELAGLSLREIFAVDFNEPFIPTAAYIARREKSLVHYADIWEKIHLGSYPELHATSREWLDFYSSYVKTYIERDINQMIHIKDELAFMRFLVAVAARSGQVLNYSNIAADAGVSQVTVKEWVSALERSGIVFLLQPYYSSFLNRAIKSPKLYFRDTGLLCYLTKWLTADTLKNSAVAGNVFETFVVSEILKSFSNAGRDYRFNVFYYRGKDKVKTQRGSVSVESEIDVVIEEDGILYPVEIKMSANPTKEMAQAFSVLDKESGKKRAQGTILCLYDKKAYLKEDLVALPVDFV